MVTVENRGIIRWVFHDQPRRRNDPEIASVLKTAHCSLAPAREKFVGH